MYGVYRSDFKSSKEYKDAVKEASKSHDKKAKVEGGWMFFSTAEEYRIWKQQK